MSVLIPHKTKLRLGNLKPKIYLSISSEGYGHSSRAIAIASRFKHGEIVIGTYGYAYDKIKQANLPCVKVAQELKLVGSDGSFNVGKTIIKNHAWAYTFNQLVQNEIDVIESQGITCVVADGRLAPVMAADKIGLPCIVVTNQSAFY